MNVLFLASEAYPLAKTGGLADVVGALPAALRRLGHRTSLILPAYRSTLAMDPAPVPTGLNVVVPVAGEPCEARVLATALPRSGVPVYLIDRPASFDREGIYGDRLGDYPDNCERFAFYQRAALEAARLLGLRPDVIHCHDWQTGLVPTYLDELYRARSDSAFRRSGTMLTVHNLNYQGVFDVTALRLTGLGTHLYTPDRLEAYGRLNFLKAGLATADLISTVSPSYAREIQTVEDGRGLDGLLQWRSTDLRGIVNGIDRHVWDPATDHELARNYTAATHVQGKAVCKAALRARAGFPGGRPDAPLLAYVGRLDIQKGVDLIIETAASLPDWDAQLIVLGTGDSRTEQALKDLQQRQPDRVRAFLEFSEPLAHQIDAGADLLLMPSRFEPCGLSQLYGLAYGAVPVVRATGGLIDTVVDATPETIANGTATGFAFPDATAHSLRSAIQRALDTRSDRGAWARIIRAGMAADWGWDRSARAYAACYEEIARRRALRAAG